MAQPKNNRFICLGCKTNTFSIGEHFMLHDDIWRLVNPPTAKNPTSLGMLCIGCVEERLGRKLTPKDFHKCYLNSRTYKTARSARLTDRLGFLERV